MINMYIYCTLYYHVYIYYCILHILTLVAVGWKGLALSEPHDNASSNAWYRLEWTRTRQGGWRTCLLAYVLLLTRGVHSLLKGSTRSSY